MLPLLAEQSVPHSAEKVWMEQSPIAVAEEWAVGVAVVGEAAREEPVGDRTRGMGGSPCVALGMAAQNKK